MGTEISSREGQPQRQLKGKYKSRKPNTKAKPTPEPRTVTVLFVDQKVGGELARRLQKAEDSLAKVTGYNYN